MCPEQPARKTKTRYSDEEQKAKFAVEDAKIKVFTAILPNTGLKTHLSIIESSFSQHVPPYCTL